jgi:dipeptidyl aminopeptidase/acylaminoacyl peptidase
MLLLSVPAAGGQEAPAASHGYTVFVGGTVVGREEVTVRATSDGITITSTGRLSGSLNIVMRRAEVRYRSDWTPEVFEIEATVDGGDTVLRTSFGGEAAVTRGVDGGRQIDQTTATPAQVLILPNVFFGAWEALTRQLDDAVVGQDFPAFLGTGLQGSLELTGASNERIQIGTATSSVRGYTLSFTNQQGSSVVNVFADENGSLLRVNIPSRGLDVLREDLAASTARTFVYSNPGDEAVNIPAAGFNLGATLTRPASAADRVPAVILLAGAAADDRDGVVAGVPLLGQLAGALADAGFLVVRYDKRGNGQSGGRAESATLGDHAEDARAVVRWLRDRSDIDGDRIAVLGHNEGAWTALLAGSRERRIAAVVTIASPSTTGTERVLEQQRHALEELNTSPTDLVAKIELQTRINEAVVTGRGWEDVPADMRKQADTPWFQSLLTFDPAEAIRGIRRPVLLVHGELDAEVPVSHADRLAELARDGRPTSVSVVTVDDVNHLLLPAVTGDVSEYPSLADRDISVDVTTAINDWLTETFSAIR